MPAQYVGVNGTARKVAAQYAGISGSAREIGKGYAGVNGVARLTWEKKRLEAFSCTIQVVFSIGTGFPTPTVSEPVNFSLSEDCYNMPQCYITAPLNAQGVVECRVTGVPDSVRALFDSINLNSSSKGSITLELDESSGVYSIKYMQPECSWWSAAGGTTLFFVEMR